MAKSRNAGAENPMFGQKHTPEALAKMSAAHLGKKRPRFSKEWRKNISVAHKGVCAREKNHFWKGGVKIDREYRAIYVPDHPFATKQGYVYEHRLVMEKHLGRYLRPEERPHHINGCRSDNRIENLKLFEGNGKHMLEAGHITRGPDGKFIGKKAAGCLLDGREWKEFPT